MVRRNFSGVRGVAGGLGAIALALFYLNGELARAATADGACTADPSGHGGGAGPLFTPVNQANQKIDPCNGFFPSPSPDLIRKLKSLGAKWPDGVTTVPVEYKSSDGKTYYFPLYVLNGVQTDCGGFGPWHWGGHKCSLVYDPQDGRTYPGIDQGGDGDFLTSNQLPPGQVFLPPLKNGTVPPGGSCIPGGKGHDVGGFNVFGLFNDISTYLGLALLPALADPATWPLVPILGIASSLFALPGAINDLADKATHGQDWSPGQNWGDYLTIAGAGAAVVGFKKIFDEGGDPGSPQEPPPPDDAAPPDNSPGQSQIQPVDSTGAPVTQDPDYLDIKRQIDGVNPSCATHNCGTTSLAVDERLAGGPSTTPPDIGATPDPTDTMDWNQYMRSMRDWFHCVSCRFVSDPGWTGRPSSIEPYLEANGIQRAIVIITYTTRNGTRVSHAFNVVLRGGEYWLVDGQNGYVGLLDDTTFTNGTDQTYQIFQTDPPQP